MARLPRAFFERPSPVVARELIGKVLVHRTPHGVRSGRIVEVEAYRGRHDPASHAYRGPTPCSAVMFARPGCVAQALALDLRHDGIDLLRGEVWVAGTARAPYAARTLRGPRIGIRVAVERRWRFWVAGHPCVS